MTLPPDLLPDDDFGRLARFVSGEAKGNERAELERWIAASAERRAALRELAEAWGAASDGALPDVDAAWVALSSRLPSTSVAASEDVVKGGTVVSLRQLSLGRRLTAFSLRAAAVLVVAAGGALVWRQSRPTGAVTAAAPATTTVRTGPGEHRPVPLPDGSEVVLAPGSSLAVAEGYASTGTGLREVTLQGEALFRVTHDERRPFRVRIGTTVVEDLGTEFVVRGFPADSAVRVVVASGSVAIHRDASGRPAAVLSPRDLAMVRAAGGVELRRGVDVAPFLAFSEGKLVFDDAPLSDVALELARWYGIEVRITDRTLRERHYTGSFDSESLDEVLSVIGLTLDVGYRRGDGWVEFTPRPPSVSPSGRGAAPPKIEASA